MFAVVYFGFIHLREYPGQWEKVMASRLNMCGILNFLYFIDDDVACVRLCACVGPFGIRVCVRKYSIHCSNYRSESILYLKQSTIWNWNSYRFLHSCYIALSSVPQQTFGFLSFCVYNRSVSYPKMGMGKCYFSSYVVHYEILFEMEGYCITDPSREGVLQKVTPPLCEPMKWTKIPFDMCSLCDNDMSSWTFSKVSAISVPADKRK